MTSEHGEGLENNTLSMAATVELVALWIFTIGKNRYARSKRQKNNQELVT